MFYPNRMGAPASVSFVLAGAALLLLSGRRGRGLWAAQGLAVGICLIGLLGTIGHLYDVRALYALVPSAVAWPTAVTLLALGVGLLCTAGGGADGAGHGEGCRRDDHPTAADPGDPAAAGPGVAAAGRGATGVVRDGDGRGPADAGLHRPVFGVLIYHAGRRLSRLAAAQRAAREALRQSERRLRATFNNASVGIVEVDTEDHFIAVNDRICQILGYRREELLGMTVHELTAPEDRAHSDELDASCTRGGSTTSPTRSGTCGEMVRRCGCE